MTGEQHQQAGFNGAHPSTAQFVQQLSSWGYTHRREEGVHVVLRAPGGGTLRVLRSQLGRADLTTVAKAARQLGVTPDRFWAGPSAEDAADTTTTPAQTVRRRPPGYDQVISMVLAAHTELDRPLGFDQVVQACGGRINRDQVRSASSVLCRDGDLDRIRTGVYQWSGGKRAARPVAAVAGAATAQRSITPTPARRRAPQSSGSPTAVELFDQLFPRGVQMTSDLLADFEEWVRLTEKFTSRAAAS